jgi:hypothetical protein
MKKSDKHEAAESPSKEAKEEMLYARYQKRGKAKGRKASRIYTRKG